MTAPEMIYPLTWVKVSDGVVTEHERPASFSSEAFGEGYVPADLYATLAAKCETLERERDEAFARGVNFAQNEARVEGGLVVIDLPELVQFRNRVRSLEDENDRLWWLIEGFMGAIATGRNEPLMAWKNEGQIALDGRRAALSPREEGKT